MKYKRNQKVKHYNVGKDNPRFGENKYKLTKEFLIKEYINNEKSIQGIGNKIDCSVTPIINRLKKYNIKIRTRSEANKRISRNKNRKLSEKTKQKMRKNHADFNGENNPNFGNHKLTGKNNPMFGIHRFGKEATNWIDGRSFELYPDEYFRIRYKILKRDNWTCQKCGKKRKSSSSYRL